MWQLRPVKWIIIPVDQEAEMHVYDPKGTADDGRLSTTSIKTS